jgi:hypothetical protein
MDAKRRGIRAMEKIAVDKSLAFSGRIKRAVNSKGNVPLAINIWLQLPPVRLLDVSQTLLLLPQPI